MDNLLGKVAVITGGASGIGRAVAHEAAAAGMRVVIGDIEEDALADAVAGLTAAGAEAVGVVTDVSETGSVRHLRDRALDAYGAVHLVHNNAGVGAGGPIWEVSEEEWRWVVGVNLMGVVHGIAAFVPLLIEQGEGHVVNTASIAGLTSPAMLGPYTATKHAVVAVSETLFKDLRAAGSGVGVSVLCPGFVQTGIARSGRNRPDWVTESDPSRSEAQNSFIQTLVDAGIEPAQVAARLLDAVRNNTFYVLTHPELMDAVAARSADIVDGRSPGAGPFG